MIVKRYAAVGASPVMEEIEYVSVAGDPRAVHIYDMEWQPISVGEANADEIQFGPIPEGTFENEEDYKLNPMVWTRASNIFADLPKLPDYDPGAASGSKQNLAYFNSAYWNVHGLPVKEGYKMITEDEYNKMVSATIAAVSAARLPRIEG